MATLKDLLSWLPGSVLRGSGTTGFTRVSTDTRSLERGDLFVALKGENFDANEFLAQAATKGAVAAICHTGAGSDVPFTTMPRIEVADARKALGQLAASWRSRFSLPLIAVTGSNGKTTVTQMVASILKVWKPQAMLATQGNLNNDIGVPLTLLRLRKAHEIGVVELGMNHPGEIEGLANMVQPSVALVNNAQREHLEFMSSVEAVARENGAVLESLQPSGIAVFPADDSQSSIWRKLAGERIQMDFEVQFAGAPVSTASVSCVAPVWDDGGWRIAAHTPSGPLNFTLRVAGMHNVKNALAAMACALAAGVPAIAVCKGLESFVPVKGRSRAIVLKKDSHSCTVIDDTYNANPDSVLAAIDVLASLPGPHLLVLGDMGEVGEQGPAFHAEAGDYARKAGIESMLALGTLAEGAVKHFGKGGRHFGDVAGLNAAVLSDWPRFGSVLVKGSRFMKMERVIEAMQSDVHPEGSPC